MLSPWRFINKMSTLAKILIAEDDDSVASFLRQACEEAGYEVAVASDGNEALAQAKSHPFELILLDVMLPGMDGFEVCRRLRAGGDKTLILMITAKDTLEAKVEGLDAGADDYVCKPFRLAEIMARVRALLRRSEAATAMLQVEDLSLDTASRQAARKGKSIRLSATEYSLLEYLMRHAGKTLSRPVLLEHVWQYDFGGSDNVLDVYIGYLRQKIDKGNTPLIHTVRGVGYRMGASSGE